MACLDAELPRCLVAFILGHATKPRFTGWMLQLLIGRSGWWCSSARPYVEYLVGKRYCLEITHL